MSTEASVSAKDRPNDRRIEVTIATPNDPVKAKFKSDTTVTEVIEHTVKKAKLDGGSDAYELYKGGTPLSPPTATIESLGIKDGDQLVLAATGDGV